MFVGFFAFVGAGFAAFALVALALAFDYRGWRTANIRFQLGLSMLKWMFPPSWESNPPDPKRFGDRLRWCYWIFVALGLIGCVYVVIQIAIGNANGS
jgi:hypothetical protein